MKFAKVGIMGAMRQEINFLLQDMDNAREKILGTGKGARSYWHCMLYGKNTTLAFSRYGKVASASTVTSLIDNEKVDLVLFSGVAGAVSPDLEIGDVVIASQLLQYDLDARPLFTRYEVPQLEVSSFPVRPQYVDLAARSAERYLNLDLPTEVPACALAEFGVSRRKVRCGLIVTGDRFIGDADSRDNNQLVDRGDLATRYRCPSAGYDLSALAPAQRSRSDLVPWGAKPTSFAQIEVFSI